MKQKQKNVHYEFCGRSTSLVKIIIEISRREKKLDIFVTFLDDLLLARRKLYTTKR